MDLRGYDFFHFLDPCDPCKVAFFLVTATAVFLILLVDVVIRHPGNVVADHTRQRFLCGFLLVTGWQTFRLCHPELKQFADHPFSVVLFRVQRGAEVEILVKKFLGSPPFLLDRWTECDQPVRAGAHVFQIPDTDFAGFALSCW